MNLPLHPELPADYNYAEAVTEFDKALVGEHPAPAAQDIVKAVLQLGSLLLQKNAAYGDSALNPIAVFAQGLTPSERMGVRMDDKVSRLARGAAAGEDIEFDLAGYIILQRIARAQEQAKQAAPATPPASTPRKETDLEAVQRAATRTSGFAVRNA